MNRPTKTTKPARLHRLATLCIFLAGGSVLVGCDSGDTGIASDSETGSVERSVDQQEGSRDPGATPADRLAKQIGHVCVELSCTADQQDALLAEVSAFLPPPPARDVRQAQRAALAKAFVADDFVAATLEKLGDAGRPQMPSPNKVSAFTGKVHAILTSDQRLKLADGRMGLLMGHPPRGRDGDDKHLSARRPQRVASSEGLKTSKAPGQKKEKGHGGKKMISSLCELAGCDEAQQEALTQLVQQHKPEGRGEQREAHMARKAEVQTAFTAERFDEAAFTAMLAERRTSHLAERAVHRVDRAELIMGVHDILRPEQRAALALAFEADEGPLGRLLGGRGHKGPHGHRGHEGHERHEGHEGHEGGHQ